MWVWTGWNWWWIQFLLNRVSRLSLVIWIFWTRCQLKPLESALTHMGLCRNLHNAHAPLHWLRPHTSFKIAYNFHFEIFYDVLSLSTAKALAKYSSSIPVKCLGCTTLRFAIFIGQCQNFTSNTSPNFYFSNTSLKCILPLLVLFT